ncbi:type VI secretion system tip protein VgrG [Mannheimia pernigra]|nr:type VI secretion system tip protein VgrG [Mannheimia pernigra]
MNHRIRLIGKNLPTSQFGEPYLWFESLTGHEAINELFEYKLIIKTKHPNGQGAHSLQGQQGYVSKHMSEQGDSPASHLNLQQLIGKNLGIDIALSDKKLNLINDILPELSNTETDITGNHLKNGIISSIKQLTTKNLHAVYQITLSPWLWLLTKQSGYRIYQNQNIPHILDDILSHYPYPVEYRLSNNYPNLDYQTQYNETDYNFIARLMSEHSINYHFEHNQEQHTLILTDQNSHYPPQPNPFYQHLIIYPPNQRMPNFAEYIEHFHPAQTLVTGQRLLADYQFKTPQLTLTAHDHYQWQHNHNNLQHYEWQQGMGIDKDTLQTKATNLSQADYQQGYRAIGQGRLKAIQVGHTFTLNNHPNTDSNIEWLVIGIQTTIQNLDPDNRTHQYYTADTQFIVQPKTIQLKPDTTTNKPIARVQTATVVAPEGEEIHTDIYGRVKVKFHWDRPTLQDRRLLEPLDAKQINTCWLRVSTAWAGNNYGVIQLPRAGQEVIVDFFGGGFFRPLHLNKNALPRNIFRFHHPAGSRVAFAIGCHIKGLMLIVDHQLDLQIINVISKLITVCVIYIPTSITPILRIEPTIRKKLNTTIHFLLKLKTARNRV